MKHILFITLVIFTFVFSSDHANSRQARIQPFNIGQIVKVASDNNDKNIFDHALHKILVVRVPGTPGHTTVHDYIVNTFMELGWPVQEDAFMSNTPIGAKPIQNIIVNSNPNSCRRLTLACHYDSKYFKNGKFLGATDSAVPCAMLITLAKTLNSPLKDLEMSNPMATSLQLIFFDAEEAFKHWSESDSLYGSRHLADRLAKTPISSNCKSTGMRTELDKIEMLVLLDLLGAANPKFRSYFANTQQYYSRLRTIEQALTTSHMIHRQSNSRNDYFENTNAYSSGIDDDHIPFLRKGVKILHIIPSPFPSVWHKLSDNESALDGGTIMDLMKIFKVFVSEYLNLNTNLL